jgi:DNA-binding NarL/FixJ family response regulator
MLGRLFLPLKSLRFSMAAKRAALHGDEVLSEIRVLLAEDQQLVREGLHALLDREPGFVVTGEARNGDDLVRLAGELKPDVVVMNVGISNMDGIQAARAIRAGQPELPILALSTNDDDRILFPMLDAGAHGLLLLSSSAADLIRAVFVVHAGGTILDPKIASKVVNRLKHTQLSSHGDRFEGLTQRELDVLQHAANGKSSKEIGYSLFISQYTVQAHMRNIYTKIEVGSRAEAVAYALRQGWITIQPVDGIDPSR